MKKIFSTIILGSILSFFFAPSANAALFFSCNTFPLASPSALSQQLADCQAAQLQQNLYQDRTATLAPYQQFFEEVGVNLTSTTTVSQYEDWQSKLIKAKADYDIQQKQIADQNAAQEKITEQEKIDQSTKISDLEKRVTELESQKSATNTSLVHESETPISAVISVSPKNTEVKVPTIKKAEIKTVLQSTSTTTKILPQTPSRKMSWWERLLSWFKK